MKALTEKTLIPLGLAVAVIGGGAWWLSSVHAQLQTTAGTVNEMKTTLGMLPSMKTDIEVIKTKVEGLEKQGLSSTSKVKDWDIAKRAAGFASGALE